MLHVHEVTETSREPTPAPVKPAKQAAAKEIGSKTKNIESAAKSGLSKPVKKRRPASAPANREKKTATDQPVDPSIDLRSFSKSLKLLGLDIPSNRREATKVQFNKIVRFLG